MLSSDASTYVKTDDFDLTTATGSVSSVIFLSLQPNLLANSSSQLQLTAEEKQDLHEYRDLILILQFHVHTVSLLYKDIHKGIDQQH